MLLLVGRRASVSEEALSTRMVAKARASRLNKGMEDKHVVICTYVVQDEIELERLMLVSFVSTRK